ncbi:MAG: hypothetical protein ACLSUT_03880 [Christensenellales bacterium]|jgi:hypothetical protein|nr:MAG TPA: hypothetical protein [Caudoviricetes sp.]
MIVFVKADGTAIDVVPTPVYQGSSLKGSLYFVGPFPNTDAVSVSFILANGDYTEEYGLTSVSELEGVTDKLGDEYGVWEWQTKNGLVTKYAGTVVAQFKVSYSGEVVATSSVNFSVQKGTAPLPPEEPDPNQWQALLEMYSGLAGRVTDLENRNTAKVLVDFTCALLEEQGVKYYEFYKIYSDGSTARMRVPAAGQGGGTVVSDWLTILTFTEESWLSASGGGYELAFGPGQTGFSDDRYMALLSRTGTETYKAGSDLTAAERNGYYTQADTTFIGSDGSIYMTSNAQYGGRLLLFGAQTFSSNFVKSIAIVGGDLFVTYVDGTTETLSATWTTPEEVDAKIRAALTWKDYTSAVKGGTK